MPRRDWRDRPAARATAGSSLPERRTQDGVDETGRALLARRARQAHRIVNDGGRRHAIEMQDLIEAQAQDDEHFLVERLERAGRHALDQVVAGSLPAKRAVDDGRRKRSIPLVRRDGGGSRRGRSAGRDGWTRWPPAHGTQPCALAPSSICRSESPAESDGPRGSHAPSSRVGLRAGLRRWRADPPSPVAT